jgi:hypothetical protein
MAMQDYVNSSSKSPLEYFLHGVLNEIARQTDRAPYFEAAIMKHNMLTEEIEIQQR